jgi:hypothetical protein
MRHACQKLRFGFARRFRALARQFQFLGTVRHDIGDDGKKAGNGGNAEITPLFHHDEALHVRRLQIELQEAAVHLFAIEAAFDDDGRGVHQRGDGLAPENIAPVKTGIGEHELLAGDEPGNRIAAQHGNMHERGVFHKPVENIGTRRRNLDRHNRHREIARYRIESAAPAILHTHDRIPCLTARGLPRAGNAN